MTQQKPTVVLVHGALAESASRNGVVERLQANAVPVVAVADSLRSLTTGTSQFPLARPYGPIRGRRTGLPYTDRSSDRYGARREDS
jgi:hypothetical protein